MESFFWHTNKKWRANIQTNYWNGKKQWIHDRQFIGIWVLFEILQIICNSKQIELENPDWKQQIKFIGRLERNGGAMIILRKFKETVTDNIFFQE